jgi:glycosidase
MSINIEILFNFVGNLKTDIMNFQSRILNIILIFIFLIGFTTFNSCDNQKPVEQKLVEVETNGFVHPDWSKNANIYEVNIRQYTPEGTIKSFKEHLPRLKELGIDILWMMPIHPIGEKNRKGTMGSYYAVKDYKAVNPEFGTFEEFKAFVNEAHEMEFKVILDWVANHTAWDNQWIYDHPEWYTIDSTGNMVAPFDWTDVADLNYENKALWTAMIDALKFWVVEADVDGYRCDVASMVPTEFWNQARKELDQIKPVFMLAEAEEVDHHDKAFDMSYAWEFHHIMNQVAKGEMNANDIETYFNEKAKRFPDYAYRMNFITNHDENSWNGTIAERMGDGADAFAVMSYTVPGMPLIYSGQETGLDKRLEFFEKDQIEWDLDSPLHQFYTTLNSIKKNNPALWNGLYGGDFSRIKVGDAEKVLVFTRAKDNDQVLVILNLSDTEQAVNFSDSNIAGDYSNIFTKNNTRYSNETIIDLKPWAYIVLEKVSK